MTGLVGLASGKAGMPLEGRIIADRYRVETVLAIGGMGAVWRPRDLVLNRPVAVKVLRPEGTLDDAALTRFRTRARAALLDAVEELMAARALPTRPGSLPTTVLPVSDVEQQQPTGQGSTLRVPSGPRHAAPRRRAFPRLLISLVVLAICLTVASALMLAPRDRYPATGATAAPPTPMTVRVVARDYVGRPVSEVDAALTGRGLSVQLEEVATTDTSDPVGGSVVSVHPLGELPAGAAVTVTYAVGSLSPVAAPEQDSTVQGGDTGSSTVSRSGISAHTVQAGATPTGAAPTGTTASSPAPADTTTISSPTTPNPTGQGKGPAGQGRSGPRR